MRDSGKKWKRSITSADESMESFTAKYRAKFDKVFDEMDREFEALYMENVQFREKLHEYEHGPFEKASEEFSDATTKTSVKKRSQISEKLRLTYKTSTSKLVSSLKGSGPVVGAPQATAPPTAGFVREYEGHRDGIWDVCTVNNTYVISACADHLARVYNAVNGNRIGVCRGHEGSVNSVRCNSNRICVTSSGDHSIRLWKLSALLDDEDGDKDFECECIFEKILHSDAVISSDWVADGKSIVTGSWDRTACLVNADRGEIVQTLTGHDAELTQVSASTDGQYLILTASEDTTFRLWDLRDSSRLQVHVFGTHNRSVTSAIWVNSDKVVSASDDRTCRVWDIRNMRSPTTKIQTDSGINRLAVHHQKNVIAIPHDNKQVRIFDLHGNRLARLPRRSAHTRMVCAATWIDQPQINLVTAGFDKRLIGWKLPVLSVDEKSS